MKKLNTVTTGTLHYVDEVGCQSDCSTVLKVNKGLPLPCKEWSDEESQLLRMRAIEDEQLFASGFVRKINRSAVDENLRIKKFGINIGEIRTEASGHPGVKECKQNFESLGIEEFEKKFYVKNTGKHLSLCPKDFIGTKMSNLISGTGKMEDYFSENFENTDLADIIIGAIIDEYRKRFVAKYTLLSVYESEGKNMNGDDGTFAKAWYAFKGQRFHTIRYEFDQLEAGKKIEAIVGGKRFTKSVTDFGGDVSLLLIDFASWINNLCEGENRLYDTAVNLIGKSLTVVSRYAPEEIRIRVAVVDELNLFDWGSSKCTMKAMDSVKTTVIQSKMMFNDVPTMFRYEKINESNFVKLFKRYLKEFARKMHMNGYDGEYSINDIKVGIDPQLMLERDDAISGRYLAGGISIDFMKQIGLSDDRFVPLNALSGTGLFFMTVNENILIFDDTGNDGTGMPGEGRVKIEKCKDQAEVTFDNPLGNAVENWGLFAANLCDSWFVKKNDLDNREPHEDTKGVLMCYDDNCRADAMEIACNVSANVVSEISYNETEDETEITVSVNVSNPDGLPNIVYDLGYSLSDGTSQSGITSSSFIVTLPGDRTSDGITINVFGAVAGVGEGNVPSEYCRCEVSHVNKFGEGDGVTYCKHEFTRDKLPSSSNLVINYDIGGTNNSFSFIDDTLSISDANDFFDIENEIESIIPGSIVSVEQTPLGVNVVIDHVLMVIENISLGYVSDIDDAEYSIPFINDCSEAEEPPTEEETK